jgi:PAS domain S-box-containing protein
MNKSSFSNHLISKVRHHKVNPSKMALLILGLFFLLVTTAGTGANRQPMATQNIGAKVDVAPANNRRAQNAPLKTIIIDNYYPYTFVNQQGQPDGFSVDLLKAVAQVMGFEVDIKVDAWQHAVDALQNGEIDFLPMMAYSEERNKLFDFSPPHTIAYDAFFTRKGSPVVRSIDDLRGKTIIVLEGDQAQNYLNSLGFIKPEQLILAQSLPDTLRLLASGKGDIALMPKLVGLLYIQNLNLNNLELSPSVVDAYNRPFSFAVKNDNLALLDRLTQGLSIVKANGQYQTIYNKWFAAVEPAGVPATTVLTYLGGVGLLGLVIAAFLLAWSFSLRKQVALRTRHLEKEVLEHKLANEQIAYLLERFNLATQAAHLGVWDWNIDLNQLAWDDRMYGLYGVKKEDFSGAYEAWLNGLYPEDRASSNEISLQAQRGEKEYDTEFRVVWPDGAIRWLKAYGLVIRDADGKALRMIGVNYDITERKQAEEALRTSEERFRQVTEVTGEWVWEVDADCLYQYASHVVERILGYSPDELVGKKHFYDLFAPSVQEALKTAALESFAQKAPIINFVNENISKDGQSVIVITNSVPILDQEGQLMGYRGTDSDITASQQAEENLQTAYAEQKRLLAEAERSRKVLLNVVEDQRLVEGKLSQLNAELERRVRERTVQLEATNQELETFSYSVSHDLRAPLRSMDGFSKVLLENYAGQLDEQGQNYLARIQEASRRMNQLINDLLDLSRVTRADFTRQSVDLSALATHIAAELTAQSPDRRVEFEIAANMIVEGDGNLLKIVLENLLNNAFKFTSRREQAIIQVGRVEQDGHWIYFVRDNGAGFNMDYANKLFGAFQRLHSEKEFPGTGIGLATVQRIIHRHGGRVWAEGMVDNGATFYFQFC